MPALNGGNLYLGNLPVTDRALVSTLAAYSAIMGLVHCHHSGQAFTPADPQDSYISNLFHMMGIYDPQKGKPDLEQVTIIGKLWMLGADHELTNSTSALLHAASSLSDPMFCVISALASGYGALHFGAAENSYILIKRIGTPSKVGEAIARYKVGKQRIPGIGHRVYKIRDPRCEPVKNILRRLKEQGREDPLVAVAEEIERQVATDKFFQDRRLCVNVDLYWLFVYTAL